MESFKIFSLKKPRNLVVCAGCLFVVSAIAYTYSRLRRSRQRSNSNSNEQNEMKEYTNLNEERNEKTAQKYNMVFVNGKFVKDYFNKNSNSIIINHIQSITVVADNTSSPPRITASAQGRQDGRNNNDNNNDDGYHGPYDEAYQLSRALNNVLYDMTDHKDSYVSDGRLRHFIESKLKNIRMVRGRGDTHVQNRAHGLDITITETVKYQNAAWKFKFHSNATNNDYEACMGLLINLPDGCDNETRKDILTKVKQCIHVVVNMHKNDNNNNSNNENNVNQNNQNNLCLVCLDTARIDKLYGEHVCTVKGIFKCSNQRCNHTWSSRLTKLDPTTRQPKENSFCKRCNSVGIFKDFKILFKSGDEENDGDVEGRENGHLRWHCGGCKKYGDCRNGMFIQPSTFKEGLQLLQQDQDLTLDKLRDGCLRIKFNGEHGRRYQFYISSFVYIL